MKSMQGDVAAVRQVNHHRQVVIPKEIADAVGLTPGTYAEVRLGRGAVEIRPVRLDRGYSEEELQQIRRLFERSDNRGPRLTASRFRKRIARL